MNRAPYCGSPSAASKEGMSRISSNFSASQGWTGNVASFVSPSKCLAPDIRGVCFVGWV